MKAKLYGSSFVVRRPWPSVWKDVTEALARVRALESDLVDDLCAEVFVRLLENDYAIKLSLTVKGLGRRDSALMEVSLDDPEVRLRLHLALHVRVALGA